MTHCSNLTYHLVTFKNTTVTEYFLLSSLSHCLGQCNFHVIDLAPSTIFPFFFLTLHYSY